MAVYSIKERLLTEKPNLMKQMILTEMFTKACHRNATLSWESTSNTQVLHGNNASDTNDPPSAILSQ